MAHAELEFQRIEISPPISNVINPLTRSHTEPLSFRVLKDAMNYSVPSARKIIDKSCVILPGSKNGCVRK